MNAEPFSAPQLRSDITWLSLAVLFFVILPMLLVVASFVVARFRRVTASQPLAPRSRSAFSLTERFAFAREAVWLTVPFVVLASFGMTTGPRGFLSGLITSVNHAHTPTPTRSVSKESPHALTRSVSEGEGVRPPEEQPRAESVLVTTSPSLTLRVGVERTPTARPASARPAWVDQPRENDGDCERIVLTSQQYATKEEAEQELRVAAVKLVEQDLQRIQTGSFRPQSWRPSADDVIAHAVQQRYDEIAERNFGKFTHPMIRVSWQVELSPRVRTEFAQAWRRELISFRILLVAGVASLFAMLASASVMYFRLDTRTRGQSRGGLKLLATSAMAGWLLLVIHSLRQGHLW